MKEIKKQPALKNGKDTDKPEGKKAEKDKTKMSKMGSSSEGFSDGEMKDGFKRLGQAGADPVESNKGEYKYAPGSTNDDSRTKLEE